MYNKPVPLRPLIHHAELSKLVSRLKIPVHWHVKKLKGGDFHKVGPELRLLKLRNTVTALIKYERIELNWGRADEARGYAERLVSEALRNGPSCPETMELADWWLEEKQLVHKLFKVLVPRYQYYPTSFTNMYRAPCWYFSDGFKPKLNEDDPDRDVSEVNPLHAYVVGAKAVLELKGNPYPPIFPTKVSNPRFIQNVLLSSAKEFFNKTSDKSNTSKTSEEEPEEGQSINNV